jgi:hypothetical protein
MNIGLNEIRLRSPDQEINQLIGSLPEGESVYTAHYDQNEDFFIQLKDEIIVPHFPIHHDVRVGRPSQAYRESLFRLLRQLTDAIPQVFRRIRYYFDPGDVLRPSFFQVFKVGEIHYLYMLKLDLKFRTHDADIEETGTNDVTAAYRTNKIFLEAVLVPLDEIRNSNGEGAVTFVVKQTISSTWIGETGRGYLVQGIWMDHELTKFFSKLFVPKGVRFYPYYPFVCRYRTICHVVVHLSPEGRKQHIPNLHRALQFIVPEMRNIENALRNTEFSEDLEIFQAIKKRVPEYWREVFRPLKVTVYLNERDMKEFLVEA